MNKDEKIYVAGHKGLVGSSIIRTLNSQGYNNIIGRAKSELDLRDQTNVRSFFWEEKPDYVFLAAAKVGGINWNKTNPAEFIYDNLMIQSNVIDAAYQNGVKKLMFLGSACIYPKVTKMPIKEEYLLTAPLEPTNEGYALSKITGIRMCQYYRKQYGFNAISVMPANLYGPNDNFKPDHGHVIPGLIKKMFDAKRANYPVVTCWGDGSPTREFLHVDDLSDALIFLMNNYDESEFLNVGSGFEITIKELAELIQMFVGYDGKLLWDTDRPNGTPKRVMDSSKLFDMGWRPKHMFEVGLKETIEWYVDNKL